MSRRVVYFPWVLSVGLFDRGAVMLHGVAYRIPKVDLGVSEFVKANEASGSLGG
jgi:hypothetical protein